MGLSNEGLLVILVLVWVPAVLVHAYILRRAKQVTHGQVPLAVFLLVLTVYTVACSATFFASQHDSENLKPEVTLAAELLWLFSPVIASLSVKGPRGALLPRSKPELRLCLQRAFLLGVPLCAVFAVGDQIFNQFGFLLVGSPVETNGAFLRHVGSVFGYHGSSELFSTFLGFLSNFSIGPFIDPFAPAEDSLYSISTYGIASYVLYAIPEEIGWAGTLYPLLLNQAAAPSNALLAVTESQGVFRAMSVTGLVWGLWHLPLLMLRGAGGVLGLIDLGFFVLSCVATRWLLTALTWPVKSPEHDLLEPQVVRPSIVPAVFAHAALNVWWSFYRQLFLWTPGWAVLLGPESSLVALVWQVGIAGALIKRVLV